MRLRLVQAIPSAIGLVDMLAIAPYLRESREQDALQTVVPSPLHVILVA